MYLLTLFLPLMSATLAGVFGRFLGGKGAGIITTLLVSITSLICWTIFWEVGVNSSPVYLHLWDWIDSGYLSVSFGLQFDSVTAVMLIVVTTISALVHLYSTGYMSEDPHLPRFMSYLSLFTFFMLILVTADNLVQLFIGWEGVGLCSYLLINFWFTRIQANKSAIKAMVMNRIGDVGLVLAIFIIYDTFKTVEFNSLFPLVTLMKDNTSLVFGFEVHSLTIIGILLLVGAVGKSAQIGLHTWLPEAMEGPTPVSALIHAATMVTAGVFLLIRCSPLLEFAPVALMVIIVVGAVTAFMAATIGLVQNDIKKVIAYSTCSQLGYMVFACGISNYATSLFHLMNHAFFKALLFLSAGSIIHAMADEQDMRKYGGLIKSVPFTYAMLLIGSLSLMGFPFLTGFYSKDAILELAYASYSFPAEFAFWLGSVSASFTAFYSFRLLYLTFLADTNAPQQTLVHAHESPINMSLPLGILCVGSIFVGYLFKDMIIGIGSPFFGSSLAVRPDHVNLVDAEFIDSIIKLTPVILSLTGASLAFALYHFLPRLQVAFKTSSFGLRLYTFLSNKWHFDPIYNAFFVNKVIAFGYDVSYKVIDRGLIEYAGPLGVSRLISNLSRLSSSWQSGLIYNYAFSIFLFVIVFIALLGYTSISAYADLLLILPVFAILYYSK